MRLTEVGAKDRLIGHREEQLVVRAWSEQQAIDSSLMFFKGCIHSLRLKLKRSGVSSVGRREGGMVG